MWANDPIHCRGLAPTITSPMVQIDCKALRFVQINKIRPNMLKQGREYYSCLLEESRNLEQSGLIS